MVNPSVIVSPEVVAAAAQDVAGVGAALDRAYATVAPATTSVLAAAGDEVSTAIAEFFSGHGQDFAAFGAKAASFQNLFVQALNNAGRQYAAAETAIVRQLQAGTAALHLPPIFGPRPVPSSVPVDPAQFAGTYYEQGSVKQFFSLGLVNTKATYSLNPDGTIRVQNSGNYFFDRGPLSSITGSAVPLNATNTALDVSFLPFKLPFSLGAPTGNYIIVARAPDYSWVLVSDPTGFSGYVLTRDQFIPPQQYQQLAGDLVSLGVWGPITPTRQYAS
ncbi:PE domain-containing protein [Mycobacterium sp. ML4]